MNFRRAELPLLLKSLFRHSVIAHVHCVAGYMPVKCNANIIFSPYTLLIIIIEMRIQNCKYIETRVCGDDDVFIFLSLTNTANGIDE